MYSYWFVGYVTNDESAQGRVEIRNEEVDSPFAETEVHIKFPTEDWDGYKILEFIDFIDSFQSDDIINDQEKLFNIFIRYSEEDEE